MKRLQYLIAIVGSLILVQSFAISENNCPSVYELYHYVLKDVECYDLEGNPTGQKKKDCIDESFKCCNTGMQTACDMPN